MVVMGKLSEKKFFAKLNSNMSQTCLDLAVDLIDAGYRTEAMDLLCALNGEGITVIVATHDAQVMSRCKRSVRISDGVATAEPV